MPLNYINLTNYRNFQERKLNFHSDLIFIKGANGLGKTNILEAISLLFPGKGIQNTTNTEILMKDKDFFQIDAQISSDTNFLINIFYDAHKNKKYLTLNDMNSTILELKKFTNIIWLNIEMINLFSGSPTNRRKFLDRVTYIINTKHLKTLKQYEYYQNERLKLLISGRYDANWINLMETKLAQTSIELTQNRKEGINFINQNLTKISKYGFFNIILEMQECSQDQDFIINSLRKSRNIDTIRKQSTYGPHKIDIIGTYLNKNMKINLCSTGEQKAAVVSLVVAQALEYKNDLANLLLLDEPLTHLDSNNQNLLIEFLRVIKWQKFLTLTEFNSLNSNKSDQIINLG